MILALRGGGGGGGGRVGGGGRWLLRFWGPSFGG